MPLLRQGSFDIMTISSEINPRLIRDWQKGKAAYGVYIEKSIPIFLLNLGSAWTVDVYFNILLESKEDRQRFFEGDPKDLQVHLYLVSLNQGVVQAFRALDMESKEMLRLKEACFDQVSRYASKDDCFVEAEVVLNQRDSKTMRKKTAMHSL